MLFYNSGDAYSSGIASSLRPRPRSPSSISSTPRPLRTILPRALPTS
ncbi:MAG: hypothetical protein ACLS3M_07540 [Collinsella sp.]